MVQIFVIKTSLGTFGLDIFEFCLENWFTKSLYQLQPHDLRWKEIEGKTRAIVAAQVQATTYDDSDLLFSLAIKNKRKICYAKLRKFMRRFVRLWGLSKLRCVKCRTLFFVVKIYRASKIIYVQYKSYRLLPSILSFHPLCIKHVSSLSHSFLNKLIADVTHTIKTDYFFQSFQPFRLTRLFSN